MVILSLFFFLSLFLSLSLIRSPSYASRPEHLHISFCLVWEMNVIFTPHPIYSMGLNRSFSILYFASLLSSLSLSLSLFLCFSFSLYLFSHSMCLLSTHRCNLAREKKANPRVTFWVSQYIYNVNIIREEGRSKKRRRCNSKEEREMSWMLHASMHLVLLFLLLLFFSFRRFFTWKLSIPLTDSTATFINTSPLSLSLSLSLSKCYQQGRSHQMSATFKFAAWFFSFSMLLWMWWSS